MSRKHAATLPPPAPTRAAGPGRPKDLGKRASILEAAKRLFIEQGYAKASMEEVARRASVAWTTWEGTTTTLIQDEDNASHYAEPDFALAFARIENHYFVNGGFFEEGQLIGNARELATIPAVIVQGRYDICCPARTAFDLHQVWPEADYRVVLAGHSAFEPNIVAELVQATDRFAL